MKYPKPLKSGGKIAFAAPSLGCATEPYTSAFLNAAEKFKALGFDLQYGPNCYESKGFVLSNTPELTGKELTEMYCSKDSQALLSCGGGELMCRTMEYVDWHAVRDSEPKWFMGYSDNTHFTFLLNTLCDVAAIYGPCAPAFGQAEWHPALQDALDALRGKTEFCNYPDWEIEGIKDAEHPLAGYNCTEAYNQSLYGAGGQPARSLELSGRMIGGCLDILETLAGTTFDRVPEFAAKYKDDGIIWFFECCELSPLDFVRSIWRLKHCGWFKNVKGFVIGRPYMYNQEGGMVGWEEAVAEALSEYKVPVIRNVDIGHLPPAMPIISGAHAKINAEGSNKLQIKFNLR